MKILILGMDGYLGWATALKMLANGHHVIEVNNLLKRKQLSDQNTISAFNQTKNHLEIML